MSAGAGQIDLLLPRLYERDIDVLLQEELMCNGAVRELIGRALKLPSPIDVTKCRLSVVDNTGETDLVAYFSSSGRSGLLLIENKIDAGFQPSQPERYRARAKSFAIAENCDAHCLLFAPARHVAGRSEAIGQFDAVVSYEDLARSIADEGTKRAQHRSQLMLRAIEQAKAPYIVTPAPAVTGLWQRVFEIARVHYPELRMPAPTDKGASSYWFIFKPGLPPRITIDWKLRKGTVGLSFWKGAKPYPTNSIRLDGLPVGARLATSGTTKIVEVPWDRPGENWSQVSDDSIHKGLALATDLLSFYQQRIREGEIM